MLETSSIGKVSNIQFSPKFFDTNVKIDDTGNQISLKAVGIETFEGLSIDSPEGVQLVSNKLLGKNGEMGELNCIGENWLPKIAAAINRFDSEINDSNLKLTNKSLALGRIEGSDMARTATVHARRLIAEMSALIMTKITRLNDIISPLTTKHHRSSIMSSTALSQSSVFP